MKSVVLGFVAAVFVHAAILLFGGILFFSSKEAEARGPVREVALFSEEPAAEEQAEKEKPKDKDVETRPAEELQVDEERPPEMKQIYDAEPQPAGLPTDSVARLDALSLSALDSALGGGAAGGEGGFGFAAHLGSGGRIGGTGAPGSGGPADGGGGMSDVFDVSELDQRARPVFQSAPTYPSELRQKKVEGTVWLVFVIDQQGRVVSPKVEKSDHEAFERPALEAVKLWRFEPAVRGGEKVQSKVRIPIRFALSN